MKKIIFILMAVALSFVPFEQTTAGQSGKNKWAKPKPEVKEVKKGKESKPPKNPPAPAKVESVPRRVPLNVALPPLDVLRKGIEKSKARKATPKDLHAHQEMIDYHFRTEDTNWGPATILNFPESNPERSSQLLRITIEGATQAELADWPNIPMLIERFWIAPDWFEPNPNRSDVLVPVVPFASEAAVGYLGGEYHYYSGEELIYFFAVGASWVEGWAQDDISSIDAIVFFRIDPCNTMLETNEDNNLTCGRLYWSNPPCVPTGEPTDDCRFGLYNLSSDDPSCEELAVFLPTTGSLIECPWP